jgi:hypothetical protein
MDGASLKLVIVFGCCSVVAPCASVFVPQNTSLSFDVIGKWAKKETSNSRMLAVLGSKGRSIVETCGFVLVWVAVVVQILHPALMMRAPVHPFASGY